MENELERIKEVCAMQLSETDMVRFLLRQVEHLVKEKDYYKNVFINSAKSDS